MADSQISALSAASAVAAANELAINEAGTSKKVTADQIKDWCETAPIFAAGSASASTWPKFVNGTLLTVPEANAHENDGTAIYTTLDTTNGRRQTCDQHIFRLTANGSAIGPGIADFFGANSALPTVTNGVYELWFMVHYLKTTANTVAFTITNTQAYTSIAAQLWMPPLAGQQTSGSGQAVGLSPQTTAASALPASGSLTTAVSHSATIRAIAECGTAGNIRLRVTSGSGTVTPQRGSYYTARRLFAGNVGTFVA